MSALLQVAYLAVILSALFLVWTGRLPWRRRKAFERMEEAIGRAQSGSSEEERRDADHG